MRIVVFGLSISSAWGNGHATLLRGLFTELHRQGHEIDFFERDTSYYAAHRDLVDPEYVHLHLYASWDEVAGKIRQVLAKADVAMVTSYCPDGVAACQLIADGHPGCSSVFYDMDTPVTLNRLDQGETVPYLPPEGLRQFDLVLSYTGGAALEQLHTRLGARSVATLYGWVDPAIHGRVLVDARYSADLSYLGTYSADRQPAFERFLLEPARLLPDNRFVVAGAMYSEVKSWPRNVRHREHISPPDHSAFYSSSPVTLNVTRGAMAAMGYCPSGRLFEATACGTVVLSDWWEGLETFFTPGEEILVAHSAAEAVAAITADRTKLLRMGEQARERTLDCHTAAIRARRFVALIENPECEALRDESTVSAQGA